MTAPDATATEYVIPTPYLRDMGSKLDGFSKREVLLMYVLGLTPSKGIKFGELEDVIKKGELSAAEKHRLDDALGDGPSWNRIT